jgi:ketosteroid isomerase-like protein
MKALSLIAAVVFLAWLGAGSVVTSESIPRAPGPSTARAADLAAIERLHGEDVAATLSGDPAALANLFTDDAVLLEPGSPAVIGKKAILAENEKEKASNPGFRELSYRPEIRDLQIVGGWAFEWGYFDASYEDFPGGKVKRFRGKSLRVLKREPGGSWKFARVMWNVAGND